MTISKKVILVYKLLKKSFFSCLAVLFKKILKYKKMLIGAFNTYPNYSILRLSTGFANAARIACMAVVAMAKNKVSRAAAK